MKNAPLLRAIAASLLLLQGAFGLAAQPARAQTVLPVLPPECRTRSPFHPASPHWWAFVLNFNVPLTGCLLLFNNTPDGLIVAYKSLPTCAAEGDVFFENSHATFNGGAITCDVNLFQTVNALAGREVMTQTGEYSYFYMLGRGQISPTLTLTSIGIDNPIIAYRPADTDTLNVGLAAPVLRLDPNSASIVSHFNRDRLSKLDCAFAFSPAIPQTWAFTRSDGVVRHWANGHEVCQFARPEPIRLWQDGGQFVIGGLPNGPRFHGVLDEVIVDPAGSGRPPNASGADYLFFLPVVIGGVGGL